MYRWRAVVASGAALALFVNLIGHSLAGDTTYGLVEESPARSQITEETAPRTASARPPSSGPASPTTWPPRRAAMPS